MMALILRIDRDLGGLRWIFGEAMARIERSGVVAQR